MNQRQYQKIKNIVSELREAAETKGFFDHPNDTYALILRDKIINVQLDDYPTQNHIVSVVLQNLILLDQNHRPWINAVSLGQIIASFDAVIAEESKPSGWHCVHPQIQNVSRKLYLDGHYKEASENAYIEIVERVKKNIKEYILARKRWMEQS